MQYSYVWWKLISVFKVISFLPLSHLQRLKAQKRSKLIVSFNCYHFFLNCNTSFRFSNFIGNVLSGKKLSFPKTTWRSTAKNKEIVDDLRRFVYWREVSLKPEHDKRVGKLNLGKWNNNEIVYKGCRGKGPPRPFEGLASKEIRCLWTQTEISFSVELCRNWVMVVTRLRPCSVLIPDILLFIYLNEKACFPYPLDYFKEFDDLVGIDSHKTLKRNFFAPKKITIFSPWQSMKLPIKTWLRF